MFSKRMDSVWGGVLPCAIVPLFMLMDLSFSAWRLFMVIALLATLVMLYHKRRHYLLLPSSLALVLAGCMAAISMELMSP